MHGPCEKKKSIFVVVCVRTLCVCVCLCVRVFNNIHPKWDLHCSWFVFFLSLNLQKQTENSHLKKPHFIDPSCVVMGRSIACDVTSLMLPQFCVLIIYQCFFFVVKGQGYHHVRGWCASAHRGNTGNTLFIYVLMRFMFVVVNVKCLLTFVIGPV